MESAWVEVNGRKIPSLREKFPSVTTWAPSVSLFDSKGERLTS